MSTPITITQRLISRTSLRTTIKCHTRLIHQNHSTSRSLLLLIHPSQTSRIIIKVTIWTIIQWQRHKIATLCLLQHKEAIGCRRMGIQVCLSELDRRTTTMFVILDWTVLWRFHRDVEKLTRIESWKYWILPCGFGISDIGGEICDWYWVRNWHAGLRELEGLKTCIWRLASVLYFGNLGYDCVRERAGPGHFPIS